MIFNDYKKIEVLSNRDKDLIINEIDLPKSSDGFYLDAYNNKISYQGIRQLRGEMTEINYSVFQKREIETIRNDFFYFRENYCKIVTKDGLSRPHPRNYQLRLERTLVSGEDTLAFFPRQSGKTVTIAIYLLWKAITSIDEYNIGISANVLTLACEVLDKIKKIYVNLPIWLQAGIVTWNKRSVEFDNGCRIIPSKSI